MRHLLVNHANRALADNMDVTPEDIAKQRHHHDIVELLTDWTLGCNFPKAVPAPTSPPEGQQSPLASMASPPATSPPAVEIHNGGAPAMVAHFQAARPKTTAVNRTQGTSRQRTNAPVNNNNNAKRKRKKARPDEEAYPVMSTVTTRSPTATLSPTANNVATSCATGPAFSPNCVPMANGLSPLGSAGISPADSTTLSPLQAPNSLDTQASPLEILSLEDLACLDDVGTPDLYCGPLQHHDSRPIAFNGRACSSAQKASVTPSQQAAYEAIKNSNMYPGGGNFMPLRKDFQNNDYPMHQALQLQNQFVIGQVPAQTVVNGNECVSPHKPLSFSTPSPDCGHFVLLL